MTAKQVFAAVAALSVQVSGETPSVSSVTAALRIPKIANLPLRTIALSLGNNNMAVKPLVAGASPATQIFYHIKDLLLWRAIGTGKALDSDDSDLLDYAEAWESAYRANRKLLTGVTWLEFTATPGIYSFGREGNQQDYLGCEVEINLSELRGM